MARIARVAADCIPAVRRKALEALREVDGWVKTTDVANSVQHARTTVVRALEDLQALGLVACDKGGQGVPDKWALTDECRELMGVLPASPEKSAPRHGRNFEIGDLANLVACGVIRNAQPWRIVDMVELDGEEYVLFRECSTGWPVRDLELVKRVDHGRTYVDRADAGCPSRRAVPGRLQAPVLASGLPAGCSAATEAARGGVTDGPSKRRPQADPEARSFGRDVTA